MWIRSMLNPLFLRLISSNIAIYWSSSTKFSHELVKKTTQQFLKRLILYFSPTKIEFRIECKQFQINHVRWKFLVRKYMNYICLFHIQPTFFCIDSSLFYQNRRKQRSMNEIELFDVYLLEINIVPMINVSIRN